MGAETAAFSGFSAACRTPAGRALAAAFEEAAAQGRAALVGYWVAGYPSLERSEQALLALAEGGCDLLEVGIPFSDPVADGPVLQEACAAALAAGASLRGALEVAGRVVARTGVPTVLMSYYNPLLQFGEEPLAHLMAQRGLCGAIVPDLPVGEEGPLASALEAAGLAWIPLAAPTSQGRLQRIARRADGFIYGVARTGTTGMQAELPPEARQLFEALRAVSALPVALGFGVSGPQQAAGLAWADGIVVGSAFVHAWRQAAGQGPGGGDPLSAVRDLAAALRAALLRNPPRQVRGAGVP